MCAWAFWCHNFVIFDFVKHAPICSRDENLVFVLDHCQDVVLCVGLVASHFKKSLADQVSWTLVLRCRVSGNDGCLGFATENYCAADGSMSADANMTVSQFWFLERKAFHRVYDVDAAQLSSVKSLLFSLDENMRTMSPRLCPRCPISSASTLLPR